MWQAQYLSIVLEAGAYKGRKHFFLAKEKIVLISALVLPLKCIFWPLLYILILFSLVEDDGSEDKFPYHPNDLPGVDWYLQENFDKVLEVITTIKNAGNKFYKEKNYQKAVQKYKKSCRYIEHLRTCMGATEDSEEGTFFSFSNII